MNIDNLRNKVQAAEQKVEKCRGTIERHGRSDAAQVISKK